jgi:DNA-binding CsgD family transcriptional regulator
MALDRAASSGKPRPLVGRGMELDTLRERLTAVRAGQASLVNLVGPTGIGKTSLLRAFIDDVASQDLTVLHGSCSQVEAGAGYGGVRALFGPLGLTEEGAEDHPLLKGAARRALPALTTSPAEGKLLAPESVFPAMHGLYWLAANLMSERPLLLALDDVHWCDERSLRWLDFMLRRADALPLLMVLAQHSETEPVASSALADIAAGARSRTLRIAPLGAGEVAELIHQNFPSAVETAPSFAKRAARVSGGVPLMLSTLLHELQDMGVEPDTAGSRRIDEVGGHIVARSVRGVLDRQPSWVRDVATALAILGGRVPEYLGTFAGVSRTAVSDAVAVLRRAEMVTPDGADLVHDVVRAAVLDLLDAETRNELRAKAALLLSDTGRPAEEVANQLLLLTEPSQPWMPGVLCDAATQAENRGAPEAAARYLYRVLAFEPESVPVRVQLAGAIAQINPMEALLLLEEALERPLDIRTRITVALRYGMTALSVQRAPAAAGVLKEALEALEAEMGPQPSPADTELHTMAESVLLMAGTDEKSTIAASRDRAARIAEPPGDTAAQRQMLAALNVLATMDGTSARRTAAQARRVLGRPGAAPESWSLAAASFTFSAADESEDCLNALGDLLRRSQERAEVWTYVLALSTRALVLQGLGSIPDALADAQTAVEISGQEGWGENMTMPQIALATVLVDRDDPQRAEETLSGIKRKNLDQFVMEYHWYLMARGRARWLVGDREGALEVFRGCGASMEEARFTNPVFAPWWVQACCVLSELGRPEEGRELAEHGAKLADRWDTPRAHGLAAVARGVLAPGAQGTGLLREAVRTLKGSVARAEHARAEFLLGSGLLRNGERRAAREQLRAAVDHAHRCGALALARHARKLLVTAGGRMRQMSTSPLDLLTGTERKVVGLAATGSSNRAIAESLFVTVRTVETHLTSAYRKLGVSRRADLGTILHSPNVPDRQRPAWGSNPRGHR